MIDLGIEVRVKGTSDAKYTYAKLVAVKGMPATGQAGGNVEITTSSDPVKVYVPDRPDTGDMDFTYNYSADNLAAVQAVCDNVKRDILIKFPDGAGFEYQGVCQTWINEEAVGGAMECTLHTVPSIAGTYLTSTQVAAKISASN
ncbi:MAG: hypothetical protein J6T15_03735 [Bacilli bacterium]|nr:hypothetical protein [Bacilli bacterium]